MEKVLQKTLSENIQDVTKNQNLKTEGIEKSELISSIDYSQVETNNLGINAKEGIYVGMNGQVDFDSESLAVCDPSNASESLQQKACSPTLIKSAIKVMKNLFSPDKTKSKPANIISPVKQHHSAPGSPSSSMYMARKTEFSTSESGIENPLIVQIGESSIKNQLNMNQVGAIYSPLTLESHNNTDESFLTSVSIIDDSFHSAKTNLDEIGETVKLETNAVDGLLNNSQNLDLSDPYNETMEDSQYCLENTTLRNGSFVLEGTKVADISILSKDGSKEYCISSQVNGLPNGKALDDSKKVSLDETPSEVTEEDHEKKVTGPLKKSHCEDDNVQSERPQGSSSSILRPEVPQRLSSPNKNFNMEKIFLNKSFDTLKNNSDSSEVLSGQSSACKTGSEAEGGGKRKAQENCSKPNSEISFEVSNEEQEEPLENSISTTTVVLNSVDSADLDQIIMSLEDVSEPGTVSPQISTAGSADALPEHAAEKQFSNEFDYFQEDKALPVKTSQLESYSFRMPKPQKHKSSISERDSSASEFNPTKIKLHKSDELMHHRISSESPEGKRGLCNKKSSLDVTLIKNTEASNQTSSEPESEYKTSCGTSELNVQVEDVKHGSPSELVKDIAPNDPAAVPVISQQSYTVLTNDKTLNRPIIESVIVDGHFPQKVDFRTDDLRPMNSAETLILESPVASNYFNASFGASHSVTPSHQKQSTPLWKGTGRNSPGEDTRAVGKPTSLNLSSPRESVHEGKREPEHFLAYSKGDPAGKTIQTFHSNEDPAEFSPVNPISENELIFSNSVECVVASDPKSTGAASSKELSDPNQASAKKSRLKSKILQEAVTETTETVCSPNQALEKKSGSPQPHKLNQTFNKKAKSPGSRKSGGVAEDTSGCEKLNATFDKSGGPPTTNSLTNRTFTKKTDSSEMASFSNQTFVVSEPPECHETSKTQNKNGVSQGLNETFSEKAGSPEQQKLSEAFDKSPQPTGQSGKKAGANQTFVKEKDFEANETGQGTPGSETPDLAERRGDEGDKAVESVAVAQSADHVDGCHRDMNGSFVSGRSSNASLSNELSTLLLNEGSLSRNQSLDDLAGKLGKLDLKENTGPKPATCEDASGESTSPCDDKLRCDPYLVQLIQEQFSSNDIEKICSVVDDLSSAKLSCQILKASDKFDKSVHENVPDAQNKPEESAKPLSPKSFDFLSSIQGKPTGRDLSRESLYVKFDPLVQPNPNSLIDFTKEGQALPAAVDGDSTVCEQLLNISPQKKPDDIVPPLTPLSHKSKPSKTEDQTLRIKELQNEIYFLKNLYAERERSNKAKMDDYEGQVAKLTAESCFLEDRLKEANEREKSLVRKMREQTQSLTQLKVIMEEYAKVISKLTGELEALKAENQKQVEALSSEKDSYVTHLQNTEAAFTDVHAKYEKSKKTIVSLKANEALYRNTIAEQAQKMEDFKSKAKEAQEKAVKELNKMQGELAETRAGHTQETARLRAQLRKTELKLEALQESLDQKIKENQQLTAICDELIEGKK